MKKNINYSYKLLNGKLPEKIHRVKKIKIPYIERLLVVSNTNSRITLVLHSQGSIY